MSKQLGILLWPIFSVVTAYVTIGMLLVYDCPDNSVENVAFVPNTDNVLIRRSSGKGELWNIKTGQNLKTDLFPSVTVSLATYQQLKCPWDISMEDAVNSSTSSFFLSARGMAVSSNGKSAATAYRDGSVLLWDSTNWHLKCAFIGHTSSVESISFSPDSTQLVTGSSDGTARLWDVSTGQELHKFTGHTSEVRGVAISLDGKYLITGGWDNTARLWSIDTGQQLAVFQSTEDWVGAVAFSPDGKTIAVADWNSTVRLWDTQSKSLLASLTEEYAGGVHSIAYSPDSRLLLTSGRWDSTAKIWDINSRRIIHRFAGHTDWIWTVAFSPDGRYILTGGIDSTARLWDATTEKQLYVLCPTFIGVPWFIATAVVVLMVGISILGFTRHRKNSTAPTKAERLDYRNFTLASLVLSVVAFVMFFSGYVLPNFYFFTYNPVRIGYVTFFIWSMGAVILSAYHDYHVKRLATPQRSRVRPLASAIAFSVLMSIVILFIVGVSFVMYPIP